ncbi:MAG: lipoate--protein ligase family protein [Thermoprotei archaeon]|nr:MAG: lipoate--protein ligase family protein [Thermoprotei archaeon]
MRELRVLLYETPHDPYMNLAFEEAFTRVRAADLTCDTLRIWRNDSAVVIGYFQEAGIEVKLTEAKKLGIKVVRRFTGGGAVYHDLGNINFALAIKTEGVKDPINYLYSHLIGGALRALELLGASPKLENINDIVVGRRKVSGVAASTRWGVYFLHGCILVDADLTVLARVLKVPREKLRDKGVSEVKYRVANLSEVLGRKLSYRELVEALIRGYEELLGAESYIDLPSRDEIKVAQLLYSHKYSKNEWNLYRMPHSAFKDLEEELRRLLA